MRQYPNLNSFFNILWISPWSQDSLHSVAQQFVSDEMIFNLEPHTIQNISKAIVYFKTHVMEQIDKFLLNYKRYIYITPKNFLTMLTDYTNLVSKTKEKI